MVDDDAELREILAQMLRGAGYRVGTADDGESAWSALCVDSFDLLITDNNMPNVTGLELLRRVRAGPLNLPTIMISGDMSLTDPALSRLLQPGVVMQKPFASWALLAAVRELLSPVGQAVTRREWTFPEVACGQPALSLRVGG